MKNLLNHKTVERHYFNNIMVRELYADEVILCISAKNCYLMFSELLQSRNMQQ